MHSTAILSLRALYLTVHPSSPTAGPEPRNDAPLGRQDGPQGESTRSKGSSQRSTPLGGCARCSPSAGRAWSLVRPPLGSFRHGMKRRVVWRPKNAPSSWRTAEAQTSTSVKLALGGQFVDAWKKRTALKDGLVQNGARLDHAVTTHRLPLAHFKCSPPVKRAVR